MKVRFGIKKDMLAVDEMLSECAPLKRLGGPVDVVNFILWLSSPVSSFVIRRVYIADGS